MTTETSTRAAESAPHSLPNAGHPITVEVKVRLQALAIPEAVGGYSIIVPALPGCVTEGDTIEEVMANLVEAAEAWLAAGHDHNKDEDLRVRAGRRMKPVSGKRLCKVLEAKGWTFSRTSGSHHVYVRPGSPLSIAVPVHGNQDMRPGTQRKIMRDAGLTDVDL